MLVLVLILVVIALVLLLAGWFLHLVVLAWISVGISLIAGLVLLYDWLQTRSAERAGRQGQGRGSDEDRASGAGAAGAGAVGVAGAVGAAGAGYDDRYAADIEPATQVLPVVPRGAAQPPPDSVPAGGESPAGPEYSSDQTVVMPVVGPSGSADVPSGVSRSGGFSSRSVTESPEESSRVVPDGSTSATEVDQGPSRPEGSATPSGSGAAGLAAGAAGVAGAAAVADAAGPGRGGDPASGAAEPTGAETPRGAGPSGDAAVRDPAAADPAAADPTSSTPEGATEGGTTESASAGTGTTEAAVTDGGAAAGAPAESAGSAEQTVMVEPPHGAGQAAAGGSTGAPVGEAPEEPRDPTTASLVARLPDEVVVIDEHPRYHVQGCRSLPGQPVIPLPVSEAVELGFTPCGWCSPNRTLGERHPAQVR